MPGVIRHHCFGGTGDHVVIYFDNEPDSTWNFCKRCGLKIPRPGPTDNRSMLPTLVAVPTQGVVPDFEVVTPDGSAV